MRLFERGLRRAGFPLSLSEGYNPRPRITFLSALPLGVESREEWVEVELFEPADAAAFPQRLAGEFPEGLRVISGEPATAKMSAVAATWEAELPAGASPDPRAVLDRADLVVERKTQDGVRRVDIRPWIETIVVEAGRVTFVTKITDGGAARPEEVLVALGVAGARTVRVRTALAPRGR
jgi:radical SAM-linked protein